jgi:hypothetical protein
MRVIIILSGLSLNHFDLNQPLLLGVLPEPRDTLTCEHDLALVQAVLLSYEESLRGLIMQDIARRNRSDLSKDLTFLWTNPRELCLQGELMKTFSFLEFDLERICYSSQIHIKEWGIDPSPVKVI